jgi:hypothetical protein
MSDGLVLLRADRHRRMAWKNGGGVTTEIWAEPAGSDLETFHWRLSMADVAADGPFSIFPGIDRTLAVLRGEGIALEIEPVGTVIAGPEGTPVAFPGDARVHGRLLRGPIRDLNVMTRRGRLVASMRREEARKDQKLTLESSVFSIVCQGAGASIAVGEEIHVLEPDDVLVKRGGGLCVAQVVASGDGAALYIVQIDRA